jgi:hypothetical protein
LGKLEEMGKMEEFEKLEEMGEVYLKRLKLLHRIEIYPGDLLVTFY